MRRYVIIGTGAIGGTIGGRLAQHDVPTVWVARGEHGVALASDGLTLRTPEGTYQVSAPVWSGPDDAELGPDDVLVLATKVHQAEAALAAWADVPVRDGDSIVGVAGAVLPVLTATNGLAAEELALRYFARVYGICVWCPATHVNPGEVVARYAKVSGIFHLGRIPAAPADDFARSVAADWESAKLAVPLPDDVMAWKRRKLVMNMGNAVDALMARSDDSKRYLKMCDQEARDVLAACGDAVVSEDEEKALRDIGSTIAPVEGAPEEMGSSTFQSLARGTGALETDYINGEVLRLARLHGVAAPATAVFASLARCAAREGWAPRSLTGAEVDKAFAEAGFAVAGAGSVAGSGAGSGVVGKDA